MLLVDPPRHKQLRDVFRKAIQHQINDALPRRIDALARELVSDLRNQERFDLIESFAVPLPILVISELLGIPRRFQADVRRWSQSVFQSVDLGNSPAKYDTAATAAREVTDCLHELIVERRRRPREDLISAVVSGADARALQDRDLVGNLAFLLFAGHETAVGVIGNGVRALLRTPGCWEQLVSNPDRVGSAVDEILRAESPVQGTTRFARADIQLGRRQIRSGELVCLMYGAANRDPRQFRDPDRLDIGRTPNRHLGFGYGPHYCLGAALGLTEATIGLRTLVSHVPDLRLVDAPPAWFDSVTLRSLRALPVSRG